MNSVKQAVDLGFPAEEIAAWARVNLIGEPRGPHTLHFVYRYTGQTCSWGRLRVNSLLHAIIREDDRGRLIFEKGWIELPANDAGTHFMCEYQKRGEAFISSLLETPEFTGLSLVTILHRKPDSAPLPCFCRKGSLEHKWRMFFAAILYSQAHWFHQDAA